METNAALASETSPQAAQVPAHAQPAFSLQRSPAPAAAAHSAALTRSPRPSDVKASAVSPTRSRPKLKLGPSPPLEMTSAPTLLERLQAWRVWRARTLRIGPASLLQSALLSDVASTQPLTFLDLQRVMETHVVPSARIQELSHEIIDIVRAWCSKGPRGSGAASPQTTTTQPGLSSQSPPTSRQRSRSPGPSHTGIAPNMPVCTFDAPNYIKKAYAKGPPIVVAPAAVTVQHSGQTQPSVPSLHSCCSDLLGPEAQPLRVTTERQGSTAAWPAAGPSQVAAAAVEAAHPAAVTAAAGSPQTGSQGTTQPASTAALPPRPESPQVTLASCADTTTLLDTHTNTPNSAVRSAAAGFADGLSPPVRGLAGVRPRQGLSPYKATSPRMQSIGAVTHAARVVVQVEQAASQGAARPPGASLPGAHAAEAAACSDAAPAGQPAAGPAVAATADKGAESEDDFDLDAFFGPAPPSPEDHMSDPACDQGGVAGAKERTGSSAHHAASTAAAAAAAATVPPGAAGARSPRPKQAQRRPLSPPKSPPAAKRPKANVKKPKQVDTKPLESASDGEVRSPSKAAGAAARGPAAKAAAGPAAGTGSARSALGGQPGKPQQAPMPGSEAQGQKEAVADEGAADFDVDAFFAPPPVDPADATKRRHDAQRPQPHGLGGTASSSGPGQSGAAASVRRAHATSGLAAQLFIRMHPATQQWSRGGAVDMVQNMGGLREHAWGLDLHEMALFVHIYCTHSDAAGAQDGSGAQGAAPQPDDAPATGGAAADAPAVPGSGRDGNSTHDAADKAAAAAADPSAPAAATNTHASQPAGPRPASSGQPRPAGSGQQQQCSSGTEGGHGVSGQGRGRAVPGVVSEDEETEEGEGRYSHIQGHPLQRERTRYCLDEDVWILQQAYLCADVAAVALALRRSVSAIKRRVRTLILCHPDERVPKSITEALKTALAASARQGNTDLGSERRPPAPVASGNDGPPWAPQPGALWPPPRARKRRNASSEPRSEEPAGSSKRASSGSRQPRREKQAKRSRVGAPPPPITVPLWHSPPRSALSAPRASPRQGPELAHALPPEDLGRLNRQQLTSFLQEADQSTDASKLQDVGLDVLVQLATQSLARWHVRRVLACQQIPAGPTRHAAVLLNSGVGLADQQRSKAVRSTYRQLLIMTHPDKHMPQQQASSGEAGSSAAHAQLETAWRPQFVVDAAQAFSMLREARNAMLS